jgi:hypothetical protein
MNKTYLLTFLILFYSCKKNEVKIDFSNKSFDLIVNSKDTVLLDFYDSTYFIYENDYYNNDEYKLEKINNSNFLKLKNSITIILDKKYSENNRGEILSFKNIPIQFKIRNPKWKKEIIYGTWVKKSDLKFYKMSNEERLKNLPPPPPPPPKIKRYVYPPVIEINKDSLNFYESYFVDESKIFINQSNDIIFSITDSNSVFLNKFLMLKIKKYFKDTLIVEITKREQFENKTNLDTLVRLDRIYYK